MVICSHKKTIRLATQTAKCAARVDVRALKASKAFEQKKVGI
jgi:hypothetical protein